MHPLKPQVSSLRPRAPRVIAIGDVHGCSPALNAILDCVDLAADDTLVTLGDYIDRGPDSRGVIDALLAVAKKCRLIPILGNHEEMLLAVVDGQISPADWLRAGGLATLGSYGPRPGRAADAAAAAAPDVTAIPPTTIRPSPWPGRTG